MISFFSFGQGYYADTRKTIVGEGISHYKRNACLPENLPKKEEVEFAIKHISIFGKKEWKDTLSDSSKIDLMKLGSGVKVIDLETLPFRHSSRFWLFTTVVLGMSFWMFLKLITAHLLKRKMELEKSVTERTGQVLKDQKTITTQAAQIAAMRDQRNQKDQLWLEQFKAIINERLEDPNLDIPSIIDDMDIGRSVFYEKVKTLTTMTPNQYIQVFRLEKAKAVLEEGQIKTVKEVAYAVGMNHPNYFSKLFKKRFGVSPSTYFRNQKSG